MPAQMAGKSFICLFTGARLKTCRARLGIQYYCCGCKGNQQKIFFYYYGRVWF